ncbi:MAG: formyltransferase family protein [Bacteroidota bacterium]
MNEAYDEGAAIASFRCPVHPEDTVHALSERIHRLEQTHLPAVVEQWALGNLGL